MSAASGTSNPRIFTEEAQPPFASGAPALGQANQGLQTPDLMSFIDVSLFGTGAGRSPAPVISPELLSAATTEHGRNNGDSKRTRESNPFQTSFESLMSTGAERAGAATATKAKAGGRKGKGKSKMAAAQALESVAASRAAAGGGPEKKKRKRTSTADMTEDDKMVSKRDRNRLAAKNCRQRKIDKENSLRAQLEGLQATNKQLLARFNKLTGEVKDLQ